MIYVEVFSKIPQKYLCRGIVCKLFTMKINYLFSIVSVFDALEIMHSKYWQQAWYIGGQWSDYIAMLSPTTVMHVRTTEDETPGDQEISINVADVVCWCMALLMHRGSF